MALGDSSPLVVSLDDPGSNPVCLDDSIPLDHRAIYWKIGFGGGGPYPAVKGNYVCRGVPWKPYWYDYITESELLRFECAPDDPHNCKVVANYRFKRVYTDDQGRRVHEFQGSDAASVTLYAATE